MEDEYDIETRKEMLEEIKQIKKLKGKWFELFAEYLENELEDFIGIFLLYGKDIDIDEIDDKE